MIELRNVCKAFGTQQILRDFSANLPEKGIVALRGQSGSGKTTLLRILAGLETHDSGEITGLENKRVSYIFQEDRLLPGVTALENVAIVSDRERAREWLTRFAMGAAMYKKSAELSGGMRRRVAAARAFAYGGEILLLDEPFTGLDNDNIAIIKQAVKNFAENGLVILVHHGEDILNCDLEIRLRLS
ncbi:MAG: ATP-binding cassette domain-containing protein [Oscillospiraceae bacterium]|nr:ATP-binding cassette domain-containing protein [Oscillospiraceae bacterium]